jgi:antitoxin (DNA-binding transcriptional repressor) of toxin-antitoxin stability system
MTPTVNMLQAKSSLSRMVEDIASGKSKQVVIARNGKPAAMLVPYRAPGKRIGIAKGRFEVPDDIDSHNDEVARLFRGGDRP